MALTRAQIQANISALLNYAETTSSYLSTRMDTLDSNLAGVITAGAGIHSPSSQIAARNFRATSSQGLSGSVVAPMIAPQWREIAELLNLPLSTSFNEVFHKFRDYMIAGPYSVNARGFTAGTVTANGGNTGNGELLCLTKTDATAGENIEASHVEAQSFFITADQANPTSQGRHNETGTFYGSTGPQDLWKSSKLTVSGLSQTLKVSSESDSLLSNPSFDSYTPFVSPMTTITGLSGWTAGSSTTIATDYTVNSTGVAGTDYYTSNVGASKPASLKTVSTPSAERSIYQYLTTSRRFDYRVPCYPYVRYNASAGTAVGTLKVTWGSKDYTETVTGDSGWLRLPVPLDYKLWPKNWLNDQPKFTLTWNLSSGYLLIDKVIFKPMTFFDGLWWMAVGGTTPFITGDSFTWTHSLSGSDAIIQKWMGILYGISLPYKTDGSETWVDPTVIA